MVSVRDLMYMYVVDSLPLRASYYTCSMYLIMHLY